jgi:hypothetical protein
VCVGDGRWGAGLAPALLFEGRRVNRMDSPMWRRRQSSPTSQPNRSSRSGVFAALRCPQVERAPDGTPGLFRFSSWLSDRSGDRRDASCGVPFMCLTPNLGRFKPALLFVLR